MQEEKGHDKLIVGPGYGNCNMVGGTSAEYAELLRVFEEARTRINS